MRKLIVLSMSVVYLLLMTFCNYPPLVVLYTTSEDNFVEVEATVSSVQYNEEGMSVLNVTLNDFSRYYGFTGTMPAEFTEDVLGETVIEIKIVDQNAAYLKENGFFDNVKAGDAITIKTTCWIHKDQNMHYLASISVGETEYLPFEIGFEHVCDTMREFK